MNNATNRYESESDSEIYAGLVGSQPVPELLDGDDVETAIDAYLAGSPTCEDLTDAERETVRAALIRYCERG